MSEASEAGRDPEAAVRVVVRPMDVASMAAARLLADTGFHRAVVRSVAEMIKGDFAAQLASHVGEVEAETAKRLDASRAAVVQRVEREIESEGAAVLMRVHTHLAEHAGEAVTALREAMRDERLIRGVMQATLRAELGARIGVLASRAFATMSRAVAGVSLAEGADDVPGGVERGGAAGFEDAARRGGFVMWAQGPLPDPVEGMKALVVDKRGDHVIAEVFDDGVWSIPRGIEVATVPRTIAARFLMLARPAQVEG